MGGGEWERTVVELTTYGIARHGLRREEAEEVAAIVMDDPGLVARDGAVSAHQLLDVADRAAHAWLLAHPDREPF
jgi:hypothetical protein